VDLDEKFQEYMDDVYNFECVGGPFAFLNPLLVLKEMDPTAYDQEFSSWKDSCVQEGLFIKYGDEIYWNSDDYEDAVNTFQEEAHDYIEFLKEKIRESIESIEDWEDLEVILFTIENV